MEEEAGETALVKATGAVAPIRGHLENLEAEREMGTQEGWQVTLKTHHQWPASSN